MNNTLVTSFKQEHYDRYAKDMIDTFREFWPKSVKLVIFFEPQIVVEKTEDGKYGKWFDAPFPLLDEENIFWRHVSEIEGHDEWMEDVSKFPFMCGKTPQGYDIQHDARHARKALTEMQGCKDYGGKVWWIDGDFITHQKVPEGCWTKFYPTTSSVLTAGGRTLMERRGCILKLVLSDSTANMACTNPLCKPTGKFSDRGLSSVSKVGMTATDLMRFASYSTNQRTS